MQHFNSTLFALLTSSCLFAQVPSYVPTDGLVGWWPFNGNANDESGNDYNGTVSVSAFEADRSGSPNSASYFDGSSHIAVPTTLPSLNPNEDEGLTISFWVKSMTSSTTNTDIFDFRSNDNSSVQVLVNNPTEADLQYNAYDGPNPPAGSACWASEDHPMGNWMHVVLTQDYEANVSRLYANNVPVCEHVSEVPAMVTPHLNFGSRYDFDAITCCNMIGALDDFGIWYRVLSPTEITSLYDIGTATTEHLATPSVSAFPNPTNGAVRITNLPQDLTPQVFDAQGRAVATISQRQGSDATIDLAPYPSGLYLVRVGERSFQIVRE